MTLILCSSFYLACQLQEFGSKYESEALRSSKKLDFADVIVYVFDSSDTNSFSYISNLRVSPHYSVCLPPPACTDADLFPTLVASNNTN